MFIRCLYGPYPVKGRNPFPCPYVKTWFEVNVLVDSLCPLEWLATRREWVDYFFHFKDYFLCVWELTLWSFDCFSYAYGDFVTISLRLWQHMITVFNFVQINHFCLSGRDNLFYLHEIDRHVFQLPNKGCQVHLHGFTFSFLQRLSSLTRHACCGTSAWHRSKSHCVCGCYKGPS